MIPLAVDENFNNRILRGAMLRNPALDIVRVQDVMKEAEDPVLLEWAAREGRVLLTHDVRNMTRFAYERVAAGHPMPGVFEVPRNLPVGQTVEELLLLAECSQPGEWEGQVRYLPL